jgi:hypothetical protein
MVDAVAFILVSSSLARSWPDEALGTCVVQLEVGFCSATDA